MIEKVNYCFVQTLTNGNKSVTVFDANSSAPQRSYEITPEGIVKIMFDKENTLNKEINLSEQETKEETFKEIN